MGTRVDSLERTIATLQAEIARLAAQIEKFLPKRKRKPFGRSQTDQSCP